MAKLNNNVDIGLKWAHLMAIWGQVGMIQSMINTIMLLGVFYTTTAKPAWDIPIGAYILLLVIVGISTLVFILRWGISGYYRYFSQRSELAEVQRDVKKILEMMEKK